MAYVSDAALARLGEKYERMTRHGGVKYHVDRTSRVLKETGEAVAGAAVIGYLRGKYGDPATGNWELPFLKNVDAELAIGAGAALVAFLGARHLGGYDRDLQNVATGILAHYAGQVTRKYAQTGELNMFAGGGEPSLLVGADTFSGMTVGAEAGAVDII